MDTPLLQTTLSDHRKYIVWRYFLAVFAQCKEVARRRGFSVITDYLDKCNKLEKTNFNAKIKIKEGLKGASKGYFPIGLEKLKQENKALYDMINDKNKE